MKHHHTEGTIAIKTRRQLARELDRLFDKDIYNIAKKDSWVLDLDLLNKVVMSMREMQYAFLTQGC